jgi:MFS family permease
MYRHLIVVVLGLVGAAVGFAVAAVVAIFWAKAKGFSDREGAFGYLGIAAGFGGGVIGMILTMVVTLRWLGVTEFVPIVTGVLVAVVSILAFGGLIFAVYWIAQPKVLNRNGAPPQLCFEILPPEGVSLNPSTVELSLSENSEGRPQVHVNREMEKNEDGRTTLNGRVELYYRASWRLLALRLADQRSFLFRLRLSADPSTAAKYRKWSEWYPVDQVDLPGQAQPTAPKAGTEVYQIRYRIQSPVDPSR